MRFAMRRRMADELFCAISMPPSVSGESPRMPWSMAGIPVTSSATFIAHWTMFISSAWTLGGTNAMNCCRTS